MTVLVVAPEPAATAVADALVDRSVRIAATLAAAAELLDETMPDAVVVASSIPDGDASDVLATVRAGEHCPARTPVIELSDDPDSGSTAFDDRVSAADPAAIVETVSLAVAVDAYREALDTFYERSTEESTDAERTEAARVNARDRLEAVQRLAGDRTPFDRLLSG